MAPHRHGERADRVYYSDHIHFEGKFDERTTSHHDYCEQKITRRHAAHFEDNLKMEGQFYQRPKESAPLKGERAPVKKPEDNLHPEGKEQ